jgi:8-oxo-dGTP pyrophosphatase MutT (NUDIX family)
MQPPDKQANPWKTLSSKPIYANPWIEVREDQVLNPSGKPGIYGVVNFRNKALGIIPIDTKGYTWLVGQYRYPLEEYSWEIPMGGGLLELPILESAQRELREETGLIAANWECILRIHTSNSVTNEEGFVFLATDLQEGATAFEETEVLTIEKLPFADAVKMVMAQEITDSLSIAGILKAHLLFEQKGKWW